MKILKKTKKGFTLVELVVVIAVVAILSGVGVGTYIAVTNNAKKSSDQQVLDQVNKCLMVHENLPDGGKPVTMQETLDILDKEMGVSDVQKLLTNTFSDYSFAWDKPQDRFVILEGDKIAYKDANYPSNRTYSGNEGDFWKMVSTVSSDAIYAQYVTGTTYEGNEVTVKAGLDLGCNLGITSVNYVPTAAKDVTLRTNSDDITLKITDNSNAKIYQYGDCGIIEATVGMNSLYVEGHANFIEAKAGHIVVNGLVDAMFTSATSSEVVKVEGNVTHAHAATEAGALALNTSSASGAVVWDYDGDAATTNKHPDLAPGTTTVEVLKEEVASAAVSAEFSSKEGNENFVARIRQTGYLTLASALKDSRGKTVSLLKDFDLNENPNIPDDVVTIDFNGHTVSMTAYVYFADFGSNASNHLTLKNGTIDAASINTGTPGKAVLQLGNGASMTLEKMHIIDKGKYYALATNGSNPIGALVIRNSIIGTNSTNLYMPAKGNYILENSEFEGRLQICGGAWVIDNCKFVYANTTNGVDAQKDMAKYLATMSGGVFSADNIQIADRRSNSATETNSYRLESVTIRNCEFTTPMNSGAKGWAISYIDVNNNNWEEKATIVVENNIYNNFDASSTPNGGYGTYTRSK